VLKPFLSNALESEYDPTSSRGSGVSFARALAYFRNRRLGLDQCGIEVESLAERSKRHDFLPTKMRKVSNASSIAIRSSRGLFEMILVTNICREVNF
jgi:hypothetical protein